MLSYVNFRRTINIFFAFPRRKPWKKPCMSDENARRKNSVFVVFYEFTTWFTTAGTTNNATRNLELYESCIPIYGHATKTRTRFTAEWRPALLLLIFNYSVVHEVNRWPAMDRGLKSKWPPGKEGTHYAIGFFVLFVYIIDIMFFEFWNLAYSNVSGILPAY